ESDKQFPVEKDLVRRLLKGKEIERWKTDWSGRWVIFPYEVSHGNARVLTKSELETEYPKTWEFFQAHESNLKSREGGKWKDKENWWAFSRKQNIEKFERDKMMVGVLRQEPSFVPDTEGRYYFVGGGTAGGYGIHLKDEVAHTDQDVFYFGGQMNSKLIEFYHKHISFIFNDKHYSYGQTFLEPLPVEIDCDKKDEIARLAREIRDTLERVTELEYKTSNITNYTTDYDLDSTILDIADSIDLSDDDYRQDPIRTNDKMTVSSEKVYQVVLKQGHALEFTDEQVRDFVFNFLKSQDKRLGRPELINMEVPTQEDVVTLMNEYESDEARIEELEQEAEQLQDELDDVILREVYDLNESDVSVVDGFLEVW
ncbi:type I restriction endonuclease subunit M, partial [Halorubrum sp. SS5]